MARNRLGLQAAGFSAPSPKCAAAHNTVMPEDILSKYNNTCIGMRDAPNAAQYLSARPRGASSSSKVDGGRAAGGMVRRRAANRGFRV